MRIPTKVQLGGLTIDVIYDNTLASKRKIIGEARYSEQSIVLDNTAATQQQLEQAYLHELMHWILYMMYEEELRNNEKFVDIFSHFLYQALTQNNTEMDVDGVFPWKILKKEVGVINTGLEKK